MKPQSLCCAAFGPGLWRLRNWARLLLMSLIVLNIAGDLTAPALYVGPKGDLAIALSAFR
jgi:hypothetical protein